MASQDGMAQSWKVGGRKQMADGPTDRLSDVLQTTSICDVHLFCRSAVAAVVAILWAVVASEAVIFASWAARRTS